jgi:hypothetical protein
MSTEFGTQLNTFHDVSRRITVAVFHHRGNPAQSHWTEQEVIVADADMVAIGGGGAGTDFPAGNMLTASHPNDDMSGWVVSSKDHEISNPVELETYVIGIKINGLTRRQLHDSLFVTTQDSGVSPHPEAETGVPSEEFVLVGGGFRVDFHGAGNIGTASFPSSQFSWKARSKDHDISDPSNIRVFAIGLRKFIPSIGFVIPNIARADSSQTGHPASTATVAPGFALVGGGAEVHTNGGAGNLLWKLEPSTSLSPTFTASSKDHVVADPSSITAFAIGLRISGNGQ